MAICVSSVSYPCSSRLSSWTLCICQHACSLCPPSPRRSCTSPWSRSLCGSSLVTWPVPAPPQRLLLSASASIFVLVLSGVFAVVLVSAWIWLSVLVVRSMHGVLLLFMSSNAFRFSLLSSRGQLVLITTAVRISLVLVGSAAVLVAAILSLAGPLLQRGSLVCCLAGPLLFLVLVLFLARGLLTPWVGACEGKEEFCKYSEEPNTNLEFWLHFCNYTLWLSSHSDRTHFSILMHFFSM